MSAAHPASVLGFWFGDAPATSATDPACARRWWSKQDAVDQEIRDRFGALVQQAAAGALDAWAATPEGRLALIVLLDQFPRNMHRGTPAAFAHDVLARGHTLQGLEQGQFAPLLPVQKIFAYLPLEHAEDLALQDRCVALVQALRAEAPDAQAAVFDNYLGFAERHREVIRRFGRFPHRNAILGRETTPEEAAFLMTPGSSF
ncbi:MAG: DUF924 domain-containing protein [Vitreoscilla sp.]|nr:DUF924 domain-containing protein [Vitreoscilla sp.]